MAEKPKSPAFNLRTDYNKSKLDESVLPANPFKLFESWMHIAINSNIQDPTAFTLSTCGNDLKPRARIVLLRNYTQDGFSFFTNYNSEKGKAVLENPNVCMSFFWPDLQQQIRIDGVIEKLPTKDSDEYFISRPRESRIGAWASLQSEKLDSRKTLDDAYNSLVVKFQDSDIPRPEYWGGYLIKPISFEFWQGRSSRLHDRIEYFIMQDGTWKISRLYP